LWECQDVRHDPDHDPDHASAADYRMRAQRRLPQSLFDFLEGGAFDEVTMRQNREDFHRIQLRRRVLNSISDPSTATEILGCKMALPLVLAPVGFAGVYAKRGEVQAARAAAKAGIPFSLSTVSICSVEEVAQHSPMPFWFQFYLFKDRGYSLELLNRAQAAGCPVLLLTVDLPVAGARHRYHRSRDRSVMRNMYDALLHMPWWLDVRVRGGPMTLGNIPSSAPRVSNLACMRRWMGKQVDAHCTWNDLEWIRANWKGKILIKGVLDAEDAIIAVNTGADGIVVSNHGGRHLDGIQSTINALPSICEAVGGRFPIFLDGGNI